MASCTRCPRRSTSLASRATCRSRALPPGFSTAASLFGPTNMPTVCSHCRIDCTLRKRRPSTCVPHSSVRQSWRDRLRPRKLSSRSRGARCRRMERRGFQIDALDTTRVHLEQSVEEHRRASEVAQRRLRVALDELRLARQSLQARESELSATIASLESRLRIIETSHSWRLTAPLRALRRGGALGWMMPVIATRRWRETGRIPERQQFAPAKPRLEDGRPDIRAKLRMHAKIGVSTFRAPVVACRQSIPVARQPTDNDRNCESTRATRRKHSEALSKASIGVCDVLKSVGMHHQIKSTVWVWAAA